MDPQLQVLVSFMQMLLTFGNLCIMLYAFKKFLSKPNDDLKTIVAKHDVDIKEIQESLKKGNDKFREQEKTNATFKSVMLAFIDFEIAYCLHTDYEFTDDLMKAKSELQDYLANKKGRDD